LALWREYKRRSLGVVRGIGEREAIFRQLLLAAPERWGQKNQYRKELQAAK
jgi:hypothetical protein